MGHQISRRWIVKNFNFDLLIFWLPDIVQRSFCTPDGAINPTIQMPKPSSMFVAKDIKKKQSHIFFIPEPKSTNGGCKFS